jgi:hypothetical protein
MFSSKPRVTRPHPRPGPAGRVAEIRTAVRKSSDGSSQNGTSSLHIAAGASDFRTAEGTCATTGADSCTGLCPKSDARAQVRPTLRTKSNAGTQPCPTFRSNSDAGTERCTTFCLGSAAGTEMRPNLRSKSDAGTESCTTLGFESTAGTEMRHTLRSKSDASTQSGPTFRSIAFVSEQRQPAIRSKYSHFLTFLPVRIAAKARFLPVRSRRRPGEAASSPPKHRTTMRGATIRHGYCRTVQLSHGPCPTVTHSHGFGSDRD